MEVAWFIANALIGLAYLHIPFEMRLWVRASGVHGTGFSAATWLFVAFIVLCGLHHLVMLRMYGHHPVDGVQLAVDVATAVVSITVGLTLRHMRSQITEFVKARLR